MIPHVSGRWGQDKPRWQAALDRRHPLALSLVVALPLLERAGPAFNLADGVSLTLGADTVWWDGLWGAALDSTGDANALATSSPTDYAPITTSTGDGLGDFTMAVLARPVSNATRTAMFRKVNNTGTAANAGLFANCGLFNANSQGSVAFGVRNGTTNNSISAASQIDGAWHLWVGVRSGGNLFLYRDGVQVATGSSTAISTLNGTDRVLQLGGEAHAQAGTFYQGEVAGAWAWNRALSAEEAARFASAPFGLLAPMPRRIAVAVATGGITLLPTGFADPDGFGAVKVGHLLPATGFSDPDAFGAPNVGHVIKATGFADPDAFGAPTISTAGVLLPTGYADPDAFGSPSVGHVVKATGFADADAFGQAKANAILHALGHADPDVFGAPRAGLVLRANGFADPDAFGAAAVVFGGQVQEPGRLELGDTFDDLLQLRDEPDDRLELRDEP